jgi:hypothetical protein
MVLKPGKTALKAARLRRALKHAATVEGPEFAQNLLFRCGPCDVCGGSCFCLKSDADLAKRLLTGLKPVGTFAYRSVAEAIEAAAWLNSLGLSTWMGVNKWGADVVVAALNPDEVVAGVGTPREVAFTQAFIDEALPFSVIGALYGYRKFEVGRYGHAMPWHNQKR